MRNMRLRSMVWTAAVVSLLAACGELDTEPDQQSVAHDDHAPPGGHKGQVARVMTRNLYLGADLAPAIGAPTLPAFVAGTGAVLRQVTATNFPTRVKGLAAEIRYAQPDLVGLQEVALWRTGPASIGPLVGGPKTATTVRLDFLDLLLDELNCDEERYRPVVIEEEFDFEAPADENAIPGDGPAPIFDAELNARLTMRDVILERVGGGVQVSEPQGGHFQQLLALPILGSSVVVTRGWTKVDARVRGSLPFRFVNTHLEAFDPGAIRALQAGELVANLAGRWIDRNLRDPEQTLRVPPARFDENLRAMLDAARAADARTLVLIPPFSPELREKRPVLAVYEATLRDRAREAGAQVIELGPLFADPATFRFDHVHPSALGHERIAGAITAALRSPR